MKKIYGTFGVEMRAYGQKLVRNWSEIGHILHTRKSPLPFSKHRVILNYCFRKKQRTMERTKRSKGREWESCCVKKIDGTFGVEMRAYGQKLVKFCKHTDASKLVVEMSASAYTENLA